MNFLFNCIKGFFIGAGAILPGISSGVLCVIFGIYEKLVNSVLSIFKDFKNNFLFLLPFAIGAFVGVILFGKILNYLFSSYHMQTCYLFIGLILGSIPSLIKQAETKKISIFHILCLLLTFSFSIFLVALENNYISSTASSISYISLIKSGALMSAGIVIPGVSSTVILMLLGIYNTYLSAISNLNLLILIPLAIGLLIGGFAFLKLIDLLLKKAKSYTYFAIIGFVLGSIFVLFPGFSFDMSGFVSIILLILGITIYTFFDSV